jgi:peptidoglycan hydrolase-like protein with peptidoglycan-binding domain
MSDLYAVFVGHLADRIAGKGDFVHPFGGTGAQKTQVIEEIQTRLGKAGYEVEKVDGKVGSNTRKVIGLYQRANGLKVDCWPSDDVLTHIRRTAAAP